MNNYKKPCTVRVYHSVYEDSNNCGHIVEIHDGEDTDSSFEFVHPDKFDDRRKWTNNLAHKVVKEEWPKCYDHVDWDSIEHDCIDPD
jgi:hypothetical protein